VIATQTAEYFEAPSHSVDIVSFIRQRGGLRIDGLQIGISAIGVGVLEKTQGLDA
jgi:hypothetical protein